MTEKLTCWDVVDKLHKDEDARRYLEAAFEEDLGDGRLVRAAFSDIVHACNLRKLTREVGMTSEGLPMALSESANPKSATMLKLFLGLGLQ